MAGYLSPTVVQQPNPIADMTPRQIVCTWRL
jgi:hypothetical protein